MSDNLRGWWRRLSAKDVPPWDLAELGDWKVESKARLKRAQRARRLGRRLLRRADS